MRILVTGSAGAVGRPLGARLAAAGNELIRVDRLGDPPEGRVLDLTDDAALVRLMDECRPQVVLHLAGIKSVVECEREPELSYQQNVAVSCRLCDLCRERNTRFVFISSDYVFAGRGGPFHEASATVPGTVYGRHKLAVEQHLARAGGQNVVVRTAGLFGYPGDFVHVVRAALQAGQGFRAFTDLINTPTWIQEFFEMLRVVLDEQMTGLFHLGGSESVSRYEFARRIALALAMDPQRIEAEQLPSQDVRPRDSSLDSRRSYRLLGHEPLSLQACLARECRQPG